MSTRVRNHLLFLATLLPAMLPAQARNADLSRARELLEGRSEKEVHEGADLCLAANNVAAVELMLEVLNQTERRSRVHLAPGHYRDIVWDRIGKITDRYARARVEQELKAGQDQRVRQWCAELLGIYGDRSFADTVEKALAARDDDLQRWAAWSIGRLKFVDAQSELMTLSRHMNDQVRANAFEALARIDDGNLPSFLVALAGDSSGGVRCALLGAAAEICPDRIEALCEKALRDRDWRPRMQAVQNLGTVKTKSSVDLLITALRDGRPVVASRALRELQQLTGQPIQQADVWVKWWADNRAVFAFPEKRGVPSREKAGTVVYNGVPVDSDHVAFLIDKSIMMEQQLPTKGMSKEQAAHDELKRVLEALDDKITFNVFNYDVQIASFTNKPVKLTKNSRAKALAFAGAPSKGREKDIWQALFTVVPDETLDTVYLLSSGEPDTGLYVHWNRVTRHLADLNRFHKVTVHTIAYTDNKWFRDQLEKIAEVTGGHFEWLQ
ncbi:MAG TPA: HEAT repeat domain-containing protein [Planctomycetota bacterium]